MKKLLIITTILILTACNSLKCDFVNPDEMSEKLFKFCSRETIIIQTDKQNEAKSALNEFTEGLERGINNRPQKVQIVPY